MPDEELNTDTYDLEEEETDAFEEPDDDQQLAEEEPQEEPEQPERPARRTIEPENLPPLAQLGLSEQQLEELEARMQDATTRDWLEVVVGIAQQAATSAARNEVLSRELHDAQLRKCGVTDDFLQEFGPELRAVEAQLPVELRGTVEGARLARGMAIEARIAAGEDAAAVYEQVAQTMRRSATRTGGPPVKRPASPVPTTGARTPRVGGSRTAYEDYLMRTHGISREEARAMAREVNSR